jgi:ubiquinone/menaquinone biosynthesis C-methylase UbiE
MIAAIKKLLHKTGSGHSEKNAVDAYNAWSQSYDSQPGNLMLALDEMLFSDLLERLDLRERTIADVGCGTGRHWPKLFQRQPLKLMGFDLSRGMLKQLRIKYPGAHAELTSNNLLLTVPDQSVDCLISTLTIAHIRNIDEAIAAWSRVLKPDGDLIITDFHPEILSRGGKRDFTYHGRTWSVTNYIHPVDVVLSLCKKYALEPVIQVEKKIDEDVRHFYVSRNALPVYDRFRDLPVIYGMLLKKKIGTESSFADR